jgi:hypothetical protein
LNSDDQVLLNAKEDLPELTPANAHLIGPNETTIASCPILDHPIIEIEVLATRARPKGAESGLDGHSKTDRITFDPDATTKHAKGD